MRENFLLDPEFAFLNHGSFGACPKPVFDEYLKWQYELERQPVKFFQRTADKALDEARAVIAGYLNADMQDLMFVRNATVGGNYVARSLDLQPGDEILTSDHEYGALNNTWDFVCKKTGAVYINHPMPMPMTTPEAFVERFWEGVTDKTKVIFLSHITSPTALTFPLEVICKRAREAGIITVIDGAHVPGHIPLDLKALDADFYTGNFHKWLCAPKSAGFLYVRREFHETLEPLIVSHGYAFGTTMIERNQWQGTQDVSAYLCVPDAIRFQQEQDWDTVREQCHVLAVETRNRLIDLFGVPAIAPESWFAQMFAVEMSPCDPKVVQDTLFDDYKVELPMFMRDERPYLRVSIQGYNTQEDVDRLITGLGAILNL